MNKLNLLTLEDTPSAKLYLGMLGSVSLFQPKYPHSTEKGSTVLYGKSHGGLEVYIYTVDSDIQDLDYTFEDNRLYMPLSVYNSLCEVLSQQLRKARQQEYSERH